MPEIDEDEELQKAIYMSMGQKFPGKSEIPKQFEGMDMMSQSFYRDVDL